MNRSSFSKGLIGVVLAMCLAPRLSAQATWSPIVLVGPGYVDSYTRQIVRTAENVVYVVTNASGYDGGTAPSSVRVYKGSPAGNPTSFTEMDAAHHPGNSIRIGGVEAKLAGTDRYIQIVYEDIVASQTKYIKFDTQTDSWGTAEVVGALNGKNNINRYLGRTGLALDANGTPHVVTAGTNEALYYVNRVSGSWSAPVPVGTASVDMKPSLAFGLDGTLHLAFYDSDVNIFYRERDGSGNWSAVETAATNVSNDQADQGPSVAIDSSGRVLVSCVDGNFTYHYKLVRRASANNWVDISPPSQVAGHTPSLYIDSNDNSFALEGHDLSIIQPSVDERSAAGVWGTYLILATGSPTRDGSSSSRWDLLWPGSVNDLDTTAHDENGVDQFGNHYALTYYLHASLGNAPPDTTPPTVGVTTPAKGATVTGTITASATASDNVAVAGVQFQLDGASLGAEVTSPPYQVSWNTATATNGSHGLTAKARDAAGNSTVSTAVTVTVNNPISDTTAPTVGMTAPANGATVMGTITASATASDNVAVAGVQFQLDGASLGTEVTAAPYQVSWNTTAATNGSHTLTAKARDAAGNSTVSSGVTVTVSNSTSPPSGGLVAAYGFNEGSGATVKDASGNNNNGTISSAQWVSGGRYGSALSFNGSTSVVTVADSPTLDLTTGLTLEAWLNPAAAPSGWQAVVFKEMPTDGSYFMYRSGYNANPVVGIYSGGEKEITGTSGLAVNSWTHLAFTYDGTTERLYVNGVLVTSHAQTGNVQTSTGVLHIGGDSVWGEHFQGLIDEVRIYNRALSVSEIQTDMNTPIGAVGVPPPDTTPPAVAMTAPANGATVSGTISVSATVADNVGVVGVQFQLDGASLGTETTVAPYKVNWDTTTATNVTHALTAKARDAAGNSTVSTAVTVTVNNPVPDTTPPAAGITSPANGATVLGTITVSATASDNVGVVGVQFLLDGAALGAELTTPPYQVNWNTKTTTNSSHLLTAKARDAAGNSTVSTAVTVTVNNPVPDTTAPTVGITAPANGATVLGPIAVSATAADNVGVVGVQFQLDGVSLGAELTAAPYQLSWNTTTSANGSHLLTAKARDAAGNNAASSAVTVTVNNPVPDTTPPAVGMTAPANGATVAGSITITAAASDNIGVLGVQFQLDGASLGVEMTAPPYQLSWNTTAATNGSHSLTAKARDAAGNSSVSTGVTVTVSNGGPPSSNGLVAAYGFNEGGGTIVQDASGNSNNGTISGAQWVSGGRYGSALSFNGSTNIVTVADSPTLDLTTGLTLEAWLRPTTTPASWQAVIFKEMPNDGAYYLYRSGYNAQPVAGIYTTSEQNILATSGLMLNGWTHLAFTYDGATERMYVNGVLVTSHPQTGKVQTSNGVLHIGGDNVWGEHFQGLIDEVRIYNRALSVSEIQTDMNTPIVAAQ